MHNKLLTILACLLVGSSVTVHAQVVNDEYRGALALPLDSTGLSPLTTSNAKAAVTSHMPPQACGGTAAQHDVWYSVTVPESGTVTIRTGGVPGSPFSDTVLEVYTEREGNLSFLTCNDDYTTEHHFSSVTVSAQPAGKIIYARVYGFGTAKGAFTIHATPPQLLANDECAGATPLPVNGAYISATNGGASASAAAPAPMGACFSPDSPIANDVWFSMVVPSSGQVAVTTNLVPGSSLTDTGILLYTGTPEHLTQVACNDDVSPTSFFSGAVATGLTPGATVYARVWSVDFTLPGAFAICAANPRSVAVTYNAAKLAVHVTPNLATETLHITLPTISDQRSAQIALRNSLGQVVKLRLVSLREADKQTLLNVNDLPAGVYTLHLQTGATTGTHKIVIE